MDTKTFIIGIAGVLLSGGFLGGIVALLKLRPEAGQITVNAAQGVLVMQTTVIDDLRATNERLEAQNERLRNRIEALEAEEDKLMQRLQLCEFKLSQLEK